MKSCCIILMALLLPVQRWTAQVSGRILDREGKPMAGAEITYKHIGIVEGAMTESPKIIEGTGRTYKIKTDKKGAFIMIGVDYGIYEVNIKAPDGSNVYTGKKRIGDNADPTVSNELNVDLSVVPPGALPPGAETNLDASKKSKEQLELIRQENSNSVKINRLIVQLHGALDVKNWAVGTDLLEQLIALDANRWEFYQNLGTIQANLTHYEDAVKSFAKGVEVAEKVLANAADPVQAKTSISELLISEGDAYNRMGKLDDAVARYTKAAGIAPKPAMAHFHACNALSNNGKIEEAIETCKQSVGEDPSQWEAYQVLGGAQNTLGKSEDALETYVKGVAAARKMLEEQPDSGRAKTGMGQMLNSEGNLLVHLKRYDEAIPVFNEAAETSPYAAMPLFNLCVTYYNLKRAQEAMDACDKALAADPSMADAYYIKASVLFGQGKVEQGRFAAPAGTKEALNKYLEYAPFGQHANDVRSMIDRLNSEAETTYKPTKK
jgi:tetratricopeptide (TPR) repeat protein